MLIRHIRRFAERLLVWSLCREAEAAGHDLNDARRIARREVFEAGSSLFAYFQYIRTERAIIAERLARRYDPGMVLNEITVRAQTHKAESRQSAAGLTQGQLMALEVQRQHLARIAARS